MKGRSGLQRANHMNAKGKQRPSSHIASLGNVASSSRNIPHSSL
jgi:hypothetical protein